MKTRKNSIPKHLIIILSVVVIFFQGCEKDNGSSPQNEYPTSSEEIEEAVKNTKQIGNESETFIEEAILNASSEKIDPDNVAADIESIENVETADPTSTGTGLVVKQTDGTYTNVFVVTQDEDRLFEESSKKSTGETETINDNTLKSKADVIPNGDGKALILAPFQDAFNTNLDQISSLLKDAGYSVQRYTNENATLERFRGSFIDDFDVVIFRTHGAANFKTTGGELSTVLLTGEEYSSQKMNSMSDELKKSIATGIHDGKTYFAFSVPWLEKTHDENFPNSWIYAGGCETAMVDQGSSSLSEAFLNLNAAAYNGFDGSILTAISNPVAEKMAANFTSGINFTDASNEVLDDYGLNAKSWILQLVHGNEANVDLFDYNKNENINDSFYLIDPESVVGTAEVIPDHGPSGTSVVYEVTVNDPYVSQVANIEFDIDNTGEHFTMEKISSNTWQKDGLTAPKAESYPRIDTFTFTAYDSDGNILGTGSATFSITEGSSKKSYGKIITNYYDSNK